MSSGLVLLTQNHIVHVVNVVIRAGILRSVAAPTSVHCARVSELLEQPVNAICSSFILKFCPELFHIISLQLMYIFIRILFWSLKTMFTIKAMQ